MTLLSAALVIFEVLGFAAWIYLVATRGAVGAFDLLRDWLVAAWEVLKHGRRRPQIKAHHPDPALIRRLEADTARPIEQLITDAENRAIQEQNRPTAPGGIITPNEARYAYLDQQRRATFMVTEPADFRPACDDCEWDSTTICTLSGPQRTSWTRVRPCPKHRTPRPPVQADPSKMIEITKDGRQRRTR